MTCELQLALKSVTFLRFYARAAACAIVQCQKPIYRLLNLELNYKISFITSSESVLADIGFCQPNPMSDPTYHEIKCFSALFRNMQCKSRTVHPSNSLFLFSSYFLCFPFFVFLFMFLFFVVDVIVSL